jgi:hypothetical protein
VWQWGSLLDRGRFSEISDIDIDTIEDLHAESIRKRGRLVYGRD